MSPPPRVRRILARLRPDDLRWRLTLWVAAVLITCAAVVYPVVLISTGSQIRDRIDRDVAAQANGLARALTALDGLSVAEVTRVAGRDVRAQPYHSSSTLLFVLVPGVAVISNHPELFGSREAERGESLREQAAENRSGARLKVPRDGRFDANLVDAGRLRIIERTVTVGGGGSPSAPDSRSPRSGRSRRASPRHSCSPARSCCCSPARCRTSSEAG